MNAWITVLRPVSDRIGHHLLAGCNWECFNDMVIWELHSSRASRGTSKLCVDLTVRADAPQCPSQKYMSALKGLISFCKHQFGCHISAFFCHSSFFKVPLMEGSVQHLITKYTISCLWRNFPKNSYICSIASNRSATCLLWFD